MEEQKNMKNAKVAKVCGIVSIVVGIIGSCCCMGYLTSPLSMIAIILGALSRNEMTRELYPDAKAGLICGIVGMVLGTVGSIIMYFVVVFMGIVATV